MNSSKFITVGRKFSLGFSPFFPVRWRHKHVCVIGSGPSAFYAAQYLLKHNESIKVDMLEKLPAPFGLVRYGVAPDHPEVKNVINTFTQVAKNDRFHYWGNVTVGKDVGLKELRKCYDAVLLAYGASVDKTMGIEGENTTGVISAKDLVNWYNGYPNHGLIQPDLDCEVAVVVGMGNVALDVARFLLSSTSRLKTTDVPEPVMATLSQSRIRRVVLIGRRGPLQSAFTLKEFREMTVLPELDVSFSPANVFEDTIATGAELDKFIQGLPRPRQRLIQFLLKTAKQSKEAISKNIRFCEFRYLTSPHRVLLCQDSPTIPSNSSSTARSNVTALEVRTNKLLGDPDIHQRAVVVDGAPIDKIDCGLVVRSIGYRSIQVDPDIPFNEEKGVVDCIDSSGRVAPSPTPGARLYASGWAKRGPVGVIVDTATDARSTAQAMLTDLEETSPTGETPGFDPIRQLLQARNVKPVTFEDWERVDDVEKSVGKSFGKPREKLTSVDEILHIAFKEVVDSRSDS